MNESCKNKECKHYDLSEANRCHYLRYISDCGSEGIETGQDNKEYCKWEEMNEDYKSTCMSDIILSVKFADYFRYCPYCGKEIRVQELENVEN